MRDLCRKILVSVAVPVRVVVEIGRSRRKTRFRRVKTSALEIAEIQAEVRIVDGAIDAAARAARVVPTQTRGDVCCGRIFTALGEDLDHSTHGVGAVQATQLTGDDLDALDLVERDVFQSSRARGSG